MTRRIDRRTFLAIFGLGAAGWLAGCGGGKEPPAPLLEVGVDAFGATPGPTATPLPTPTATPTVRPPGIETRTFLPGTQWETQAVITASGVAGPALMVLGGVHGNEPGGWLAAEQVATWLPAAGTIIVVPRANVRAIDSFVRHYEEDGDLNRLYPGQPESALAMERMAAEITSTAREFAVEIVLDLHESWAFYAERAADQGGTAFLGQTITTGPGPRVPFGQEIIDSVNPGITVPRDLLVVRNRSPFQGSNPGRGSSSLSLGIAVPGLTPVLVEMGQQGNSIERRTELHLTVVRAAMDLLGM